VFIKDEPAEDDPLRAALGLLRFDDPVRNITRLVRHPLLAAEALGRPLLRGRFPVRSVSGLSLQCIVEQAPDNGSRMTLAQRTDALGVPLVRIDWRTSELEQRTARRTARLFISEMARLGMPAPTPVPMVASDEADFFLPDVAHPAGTTRMSADRADGVVDIDCQVHGVDGLYVVGSSVFPTSGHANPTHTIVALAIRLADHLKQQLVAATGQLSRSTL
jgi:choline dehydrogenase-like flavoprotein